MSDRWLPKLFGGPHDAETPSLKTVLEFDRLEERETPCATCGMVFGGPPMAMVGPPVFAYAAGQQTHATGYIPPTQAYGYGGQWGGGYGGQCGGGMNWGGFGGMSSGGYSMYGGGSYSAFYQQLLSSFYSQFASSSSYSYGGGYGGGFGFGFGHGGCLPCQLGGLRALAQFGI